MEYSKAVEHRYNINNLHLDAGERAALKKALPGNGEGWFDIYEYANAWAKSLLLDGAPALGINEFYEEPGGYATNGGVIMERITPERMTD